MKNIKQISKYELKKIKNELCEYAKYTSVNLVHPKIGMVSSKRPVISVNYSSPK